MIVSVPGEIDVQQLAAQVLAVMARTQGIDDHEYLLTRLAGLEDAPEREIDREQALVRRGADETAHRHGG